MKVCEITGKVAMVGNNVSHSNRKTKRKFSPNLKTKRFWSEEENRWITLKVSTAGMKTINKKGLANALKEAVAARKVY
ncbi:MAG: 50S ribosomal protein L28 [Rikenellaceae bacterium]|jgi:large subunit ribosomal protein L28|nr:50S ribosomal protein L28 [Rikenellaceae bacterium]MBQ2019828.1 50S ribosomal protein L28 [Rikenellaceae bacterium]MBQ2413936.1 50S ribosomal protein L28 [Rikenellaceae bacterium]MBQ5371178.1 50S ribosomal protein L28 [Rikenellaceae bacterium]MBQ5595974.1 50S ribosomal protein L28 [Rikenellaceae bacterium]